MAIKIPKKKICIFGTGGFGREVLCCVIDVFKKRNFRTEYINYVVCFMVSDDHYKENTIMGIEVIKQSLFNPLLYDVVIAIGEPLIRQNIVNSLPSNTTYATIIHPSVIMSKSVNIGEGSIITANTILTCNIKIGKHAHVNLNTTIGHDCNIGDYFTTAPATNVSGNVNIGDCVYLGTNSSIKQGISICNDVTIGMGGVVVNNIKEKGVYIGNPTIKLVKN
jgi:sugar O-acyltransferase (sialic acid O-acetyltransferase NeuD family)